MKHRYFAVVAAALSLSACATLPEAPPVEATPATYKALGTEPFWSLAIEGKRMMFTLAGEHHVFGASAVSSPSVNGWRYTSKNVTADAIFTPCSDGMSDRTYKDTVTVMVGNETYKGCGGGILPPASLERTVWRIASINGAEILASQGALVSFGDGRMSGTVGCNRLGSDYTYAAGKLGFGPVMSTRMACQEPLTSQEYAFVSLLGASPATSFTNNGSLILSGKDGAVIVLEQSI
jgi:heat shock protein HslJ